MSKLSFKEIPYYEDDIDDEVSSSENNDNYNKTVLNKSSNTLYNKGDSSMPNDLIQYNKDMNSSSIMNVIDNNIESYEADGNIQDVKKKKRKKKKKSNSNLQDYVNIESLDENHSNIIQNDNINDIKRYEHSSHTKSKFLSRFLDKKKEIVEIIVPEIQIANDLFLRQFNQAFVNHHNDIDTYSSDDDSIEESCVSNTDVDIRNTLENYVFLGTEINNNDSTNYLNDVVNLPNNKLQIYNLPYKITKEEIEDFGKRYDCNFINIKLGIDKKTKLPSGSATVEIMNTSIDGENKDLSELIKTMHGENCCGRPARIQRYTSGNTSARNSLSKEHGRYFADEISCKCNLCGQVGHRQADCVNDPIPTPCHLCAGQDHDAG